MALVHAAVSSVQFVAAQAPQTAGGHLELRHGHSGGAMWDML
ncbi:MAG: hypothetical protein ABSB86_14815 [Bryobacteraceae bacterium]